MILNRLLTTQQVATSVGVSASRVRQLARARKIEPQYHIGRAMLWNRDDLPLFKRRRSGRPRTEC